MKAEEKSAFRSGFELLAASDENGNKLVSFLKEIVKLVFRDDLGLDEEFQSVDRLFQFL